MRYLLLAAAELGRRDGKAETAKVSANWRTETAQDAANCRWSD
jgi:hypothetical protein